MRSVKPNLPRQALRVRSIFSTVKVTDASHDQRCTQRTVKSMKPDLPRQALRVWSSLSTVREMPVSDVHKKL